MNKGEQSHDLETALRIFAADALQKDEPHPSTEDLHLYHSRALSVAEADRIQEHLSLCRSCFDEVRALVEQARRQPVSRWGAFWRSSGPAYALSALCLVLAVSAWLVRPGPPQPRVNVDIQSLSPAVDRSVSGPEVPIVRRYEGARTLLLILGSVELRSFPRYRIDLLKEGASRPIWSSDEALPMSAGEFTVELPADLLSKGPHSLRLTGIDGETSEELSIYPFRIE